MRNNDMHFLQAKLSKFAENFNRKIDELIMMEEAEYEEFLKETLELSLEIICDNGRIYHEAYEQINKLNKKEKSFTEKIKNALKKINFYIVSWKN